MNEGLGIPPPVARKCLKEEWKNETTADMCVSIQLFQVGLRQGPSSVFGARFVANQYENSFPRGLMGFGCR